MPVKLEGDTNGFVIDQAGKLDTRVEYKPQSWFFAGLAVTVLSFLLALSYVMIRDRKNLAVTAKTLPQQDFGIPLSNSRTSAESSTTRAVLRKVFGPIMRTSVALVLLFSVLFYLIQGQTSAANDVMIYIYFLLVVGVIWQFVLFLKEGQGIEISQSEKI